jgi:hypothetical protein
MTKAVLDQARASGGSLLRERDFYTWCLEQAALVRAGRFDRVDAVHIAEELETLGRSQFRELRSNVARVIQHMLKWDYQSYARSKSWVVSIGAHRKNIRECLLDNPGLKARIDEIVEQAFRSAIEDVIEEAELERRTLPPDCPYSWQEIAERPFDWDRYRTP